MNCQFIKKNSDKCQALSTKNSRFCFFHNPESKKDHQLATMSGGLNSRKNSLDLPQRVIRTPREVVLILEETLNHLRAGNIHPNYSNSIFIGCSTLLKALEQSEVMQRIEAIEDTLKMQNSR